MSQSSGLDRKIFFPSILLTLLVAAPLIGYAEDLQTVIKEFYRFMTVSIGWAYMLVFVAGFCLSFYVAYGPYGKIRLGGPDRKPRFGQVHWVSMIIASGYGIGIINWSMIEPANTMALAPLGGGANSAYALEVATAYGIFHWGMLYWCVYLLPCIPIFYFLGVKRVNRQRVSQCLTPLWGEKNTNGTAGTLFDIFVVIALVGGIGVTLGTAVPLVAGLLAPQIGIQDGRNLQMAVLAIFTLLTMYSVFQNIDKGMKILSDVNSVISMALLTIVLVGGPTAYLLNLGTSSLGMVVDLFPRMATWTDPLGKTSFPADWTIFYSAWYLAYGPMMGIFITAISMGRTLKEVILGCILWGNIAAILFFFIMGGFALHLQYNSVFDVYSHFTQHGVAATVYKVLGYAPLSSLLKPVYLLIATVFLVTTIDAAVRVLASMTSKEMYADQESSPVSKLCWTIVLAMLVMGVLFVGGINVIQFLAVGSTVPLLVVCVFMCVAMFRSMRKDYPELADKQP